MITTHKTGPISHLPYIFSITTSRKFITPSPGLLTTFKISSYFPAGSATSGPGIS